MFRFDRVRQQVRWGRVLPLMVLCMLLGVAAALGLLQLGVIPRWLLSPLGNGIGFVLIWLWLPDALRPGKHFPFAGRFLVGLASAGLFLVFMIMATWSDLPPWLR
jgi:hypothetical protein